MKWDSLERTASGIEELCTRIQKVVTVDIEVMTVKVHRIAKNTGPRAETIMEGGVGEENIFPPTLLGSLAWAL